ncbi:MAG: protein TolA [Cycloclasticus sp. symbiont of Poecilosclerida sp. N]|nr:MAG: protein TolA [Cycloclasticus sp. symbiont of Poecilosclerida sp. N]
MLAILKKHPLAFILSVTFHLLLIGFFVFSADFFDEEVQARPSVNIVKAMVIDESKVRAEAQRLKKLEKQKALREKKRLDDIKKQLNDIKKQRLAEEKKIADAKKQVALNKKKLEKQKRVEAAKQAKLKKQQALDKKKKAAAEKKKKAAAEKKKLADAKRNQERLAKEQADREQDLRAQAALEEKQMRAQAAFEEEQRRAQVAVGSFSNLIRQKVERNWIQPAGDISGLSCVVRVRLIPGGEVVDAQVIESSGNAVFDRSVELATRKAAPLPLPKDPSLFNYFRTLEFYFRPGGNKG